MTIDELYKFIQFIANKEQRGFIKPSEFNMLAKRAQIDLIHDRVARYKGKDKPSEILEQSHSVLDDIRTVVERKKLIYNNININPDQDGAPNPNPYPEYDPNKKGAFSYPNDYLHFIRLHMLGTSVGNAFNTSLDGAGDEIKLLTQDQLSRRRGSFIVPITISDPVAAMVDEGFEIFDGPESEVTETWSYAQTELRTENVFLTYIKRPKDPHWGYTMVNDMYVFNPSSPNTVELELPEKTHSEIAQRMLSYIGISLRDREPLGYAEAKMKDQKQ